MISSLKNPVSPIASPCLPSHPRPYSDVNHRWAGLTGEDMGDCLQQASQISQLPVGAPPKIVVPKDGYEMLLRIIRPFDPIEELDSNLADIPFTRLQRVGVSVLKALTVFQAPVAAYVSPSHECLLNPWLGPVLNRLGMQSFAKSIVTHECVHALQKQSYPAIHTRLEDSHKELLRIQQEATVAQLSRDEDLAPIKQQMEKITANRIWDKVATEGHAHWVQRKAFDFFGASSMPWYQRIVLPVVDSAASSPEYVAGAALFETLEKWQPTDIDSREISGSQSRHAAYDLIHTVMSEPDLIEQLLPNYQTGKTLQERSFVELAPLLQKMAGLAAS